MAYMMSWLLRCTDNIRSYVALLTYLDDTTRDPGVKIFTRKLTSSFAPSSHSYIWLYRQISQIEQQLYFKERNVRGGKRWEEMDDILTFSMRWLKQPPKAEHNPDSGVGRKASKICPAPNPYAPSVLIRPTSSNCPPKLIQ